MGVMTSSSFFSRYTGTADVPATMKEWMIPPENLGLCTNGRIFHDPSGAFTEHRRQLEDNYPEPLRIKRIAARCLDAGQAGQYNLARSKRRGEAYAAFYDTARFCDSILKLVFLLNRRFPPYYKWLQKAAVPLMILGKEAVELTANLSGKNAGTDDFQLVEDFCALVVKELRRQSLSELDDDFLVNQAMHINESLDDEELGQYPLQYF